HARLERFVSVDRGIPDDRGSWRRYLPTALAAVLSLPGLYHLSLLATAVARRFSYPYDLEWMEGGLLIHSLRIQRGEPIYVPPSVDFVPYLYPPLYPTAIAALAPVFGVTYALGRAVSIASLLTIIVSIGFILLREGGPDQRAMAACAASLAAGLFAASYPW